MMVLLSILLTELKVFGVSLRSPMVSIVLSVKKNVYLFLLLTVLSALYLKLGGGVYGYDKNNLLTFVVISFGLLYVTFMKKRLMGHYAIKKSLTVVYILFLFVGFIEWLGVDLIGSLFRVGPFIAKRASGFSGEPSFFATMSFYFYLLGRLYESHKTMYLNIYIGIIFLLSMSFSIILYGVIFFGLMIMDKVLILSKDKMKYQLMGFVVLILFFCLDFLAESVTGQRISVYSLFEHGSWRMFSDYAVLNSANFFKYPTFGDGWDQIIANGQYKLVGGVYRWITQPWSLFSMYVVEFGLIMACFIYITLLGYSLRFMKRSQYVLVVTLVVLGFFFVPKWCVYYFFIPFIDRS